MFSSIFEGFILGLGAALPIGPINVLIVNEAMFSYANSVAIGFGAMSADLTYLLLIFSGVMIKLKDNRELFLAFSLLSGVFLIYLAYTVFMNRDFVMDLGNVNIKLKGTIRSYLKGYSLTLLNPYTVGFWFSVSAYILSRKLKPFFTMLGVMFAILLWITFMPLVVHRTKYFISARIFRLLSLISSLIIAVFGFLMLKNAIFLLFKYL